MTVGENNINIFAEHISRRHDIALHADYTMCIVNVTNDRPAIETPAAKVARKEEDRLARKAASETLIEQS